MTDSQFIDELDAAAFVGMVQWAISEPEIVARFTADTGCKLSAPKSAIERMIDEASGYDRDVCERFMRWCEAELWGKSMPRLIREQMERNGKV